MKKGICYIVSAGENYGLDFTPGPSDFVIAADAGYRYLAEAGIPAGLVIGDFDTLRDIPRHPHVTVLQPEKDDTDTVAALRAGLEAGYARFHFYCGTGGRIDHTLANIQTLAYLARRGMRGLLFDRDCVLTAVTDGALSFAPVSSGYLSVFSLSDRAEGVCLRGLKYPLEDAELSNTFPLGVSNEFLGQASSVSVGKGTLLVVFPRAERGRLRE